MKRILISLAFMIATSSAAHAACYADYKAKQDNPLRLHYGVLELPQSACGSAQSAAQAAAPRLARAGWTLLNIVSVFDQKGLDRRRANAGAYFLRF